MNSFASIAALTVSGTATVANLVVSGVTTFTTIVVNGAATVNGVISGASGILSDTYSNYTPNGPVTLRTTGGNANVLVSPNGTGSVVVKSGSGLTADTIAPTTAGPLSISTSSNGNLRIATGSGAVALSCAGIHPITVNNTSTTVGNDILFQSNGTNIAGFGANQTTNEAFAWSYANQPLTFGTNSTERFRIAAGGIANDNTITSILGLQGTTLTFKNNVVDTSSTQTLTGKTLDSAADTMTITSSPLVATNINALLNQDVRTTASPTFAAITAANATFTGLAAGATFDIVTKNGSVLQSRTTITNQQLLSSSSPTFTTVTANGGVTFSSAAQVIPASGTVAASTTLSIFSSSIATSSAWTLEYHGTVRGNAGEGYGEYRYSYRAYNNAGTITFGNGVSQDKSEANVVGGFTGKVAFSLTAGGATASINLVNTLAAPVTYSGLITLYKA